MKFLKYLKNVYLFKKFCKTKFLDSPKKNKNNLILFEFNSITDCYIIYSYFISHLSKKYDSRVLGFQDLKKISSLNILRIILMKMNPISKFNIYKSFGVENIIYFFSIDKNQKKIIDKKYQHIIKNTTNKKKFEKLRIKNVLVGDLFYDTYLKKFSKVTIDFNSKEFKDFLYLEISKFYFWEDYINKNVKSIVVSHTVYTLAVPMRICIKKKIDAFQVSWDSIFRLNNKQYMAHKQHKYYPKVFSKLSNVEKSNGLKKAKEKLDLRLKGNIGIDMVYSKKSSYGKYQKNKRLLKKSSKLKVLIASHCFFDSPHSYGYNLFPDFYEWLKFLGKMANQTKYDWYIKTHSDFLPGSREKIQQFVKKYPKIKLLPANSSHHQLIREGISAVLTTYGTIGCEYPLFNKLVINASVNNPHIAYNFNYHCKSIKDYEISIKNLHNLIKNFSPNKKQVYEYYYMHHIHENENIFYENLMKFKNQHNEYEHLNKWPNQILKNTKIDETINYKIKKFIYGNNYFSKF